GRPRLVEVVRPRLPLVHARRVRPRAPDRPLLAQARRAGDDRRLDGVDVSADAARRQLQRLYRSGGDASARAPTPLVHRVADQQIFPLALEVTRGCPYTCDFCVLTGMGTRFDTRPAARVEHDLVTLRAALKGRITGPLKNKRRRMAMFYDNN